MRRKARQARASRYLRIGDILCRTEANDGTFSTHDLFPPNPVCYGTRLSDTNPMCDDDSKLFNALGTTSETVLVDAEIMLYHTPYDHGVVSRSDADAQKTTTSLCRQFFVFSRDRPVEGVLPIPWRTRSGRTAASHESACYTRRRPLELPDDTVRLRANARYLHLLQARCDHERLPMAVERVPLAADPALAAVAASTSVATSSCDGHPKTVVSPRMTNVPLFFAYSSTPRMTRALFASVDHPIVIKGVDRRRRAYHKIRSAFKDITVTGKQRDASKVEARRRRQLTRQAMRKDEIRRIPAEAGFSTSLRLAVPALRTGAVLSDSPQLWYCLFARCFRWLDISVTRPELGDEAAATKAGAVALRSLCIRSAPAQQELRGVRPQWLWHYFCLNHSSELPDLLLRAYDMYTATRNAVLHRMKNLYGVTVEFFVPRRDHRRDDEEDYIRSLAPRGYVHGFVIDGWMQSLLTSFGDFRDGRRVRLFSYLSLEVFRKKVSTSSEKTEANFNQIQFVISPETVAGATDLVFPINVGRRHWIVAHYTFQRNRHNLFVFDSLDSDSLKSERTAMIRLLQSAITSCWPKQAGGGQPDEVSQQSKWSVSIDRSVTQEPQSNDCGMFAIQFITSLFVRHHLGDGLWLRREHALYVLFAIPKENTQQRLLDVVPFPEPQS
jgi:hypothetical protein